MLILLVVGTLAGGVVGFQIGVVYNWTSAAVGAQLGASAGVALVAAVLGGR